MMAINEDDDDVDVDGQVDVDVDDQVDFDVDDDEQAGCHDPGPR